MKGSVAPESDDAWYVCWSTCAEDKIRGTAIKLRGLDDETMAYVAKKRATVLDPKYIEAFRGNKQMTYVFGVIKLAPDRGGAITFSFPRVLMNPDACWTCGKVSVNAEDNTVIVKLCKRCEIASYCSPECQKKGWNGGHKTICSVWGSREDREKNRIGETEQTETKKASQQ